MKVFEYSTRVYFSDTDAQGIAYHASYVDWAEHGRTELFHTLFPSVRYSDLYEKDRLIITVKRLKIVYKRPALLDDIITVRTHVDEVGACSAVFRQDVCRGDEILTELTVRLAFTDADTMRPERMSDEVKQALSF